MAVVEAFRVLKREPIELWEFLVALEDAFDIDDVEVLRGVAAALDDGDVRTAFDAYHLVSALSRGEALHTADEELLASDYPTVRF